MGSSNSVDETICIIMVWDHGYTLLIIIIISERVLTQYSMRSLLRHVYSFTY